MSGSLTYTIGFRGALPSTGQGGARRSLADNQYASSRLGATRRTTFRFSGLTWTAGREAPEITNQSERVWIPAQGTTASEGHEGSL